ncbi:VOC family protein [Cryptosporangium arvum]|uniref:Lactoylglutathione lyase-like lyase n=1 Tax=Cryptosporangium arvum DSM 44712 TaxID=927661 RepID=A0A010ZV95_9ACTN|nr:VOC family protein [Cryptosporangium arvum]EXG82619.1 lactoylglutathione lyase-like lyase [Cryptosporangium arvum DSM 44712]
MFTVTRMNHIGVPVSDLDRSVRWYEDVLGIAANGVTISADNAALGAVLEVENPAMRAAFSLAGDNVLLELIQYDRPTPKPFTGRNCDVGMMHLCFEVDDLDAAVRDLKERGVHLNADPVVLAAGDGIHPGALAGTRILYLRDPDGIQLELFELAR